MNKLLPTTLARLFKRFSGEKKVEAASSSAAKQPPHTTDEVAFKSGAAVAFITPIGAYAGSDTQRSLRKRAEQQFQQMDVSTHKITMN